MSAIRRMLTACMTAGAAALLLSWLIASPSWAATVTPIASGLDNPRDLAFDSDGDLFVAEAGHGSEPAGSECAGEGESGEPLCVGFTSGVSQIEGGGRHHRVTTGFVSLAGPDGSAATGIDGISILGDWTMWGIETESSNAVPPTGLSEATAKKAKSQLGRLGELRRGGQVRGVADVGGFDFQWSKEHISLAPKDFPDANPYAVLATPYGTWVVDAGANTLDFVRPNGEVKVVAFFPGPDDEVGDSVPTCIDRGPDGALYLGELTAASFPPGSARIWRVVPGHQPEVVARGLTAVTGCGFGPDGKFYAVEFSTQGLINGAPETGAVVRVAPHGTSPEVVVDKLNFPGGFAAGRDAIYVSSWSIAPANSQGGPTGEVLRISIDGQGTGGGGDHGHDQGDDGHGHGDHGDSRHHRHHHHGHGHEAKSSHHKHR